MLCTVIGGVFGLENGPVPGGCPSKMGKWTGMTGTIWIISLIWFIDKLYITQSEWTNWFGGAKTRKEEVTYKKLPFDCCALSLKPYNDPVCTPDGIIFDLLHIVPYIRKHGNNPVTGETLDTKDLTRLTIHKNADGQYYCPVTLRNFHENLHIVANKKTGHVYAMEAIETLNNWSDFFTGEPFTKEDLIDLQNPKDLQKSNVVHFKHIQEMLTEDKTEDKAKEVKQESKPKVNVSQSVGKLINTIKDNGAQETARTTGKVAASLTSTFMTPVTSNEYKNLDPETLMFKSIKTPGKVLMRTNFGDMIFELDCHKVPKTCYNFIQLAKKGYYQRVRFHRLVPGFVIQGGDPTGDGTGGESIWGKPFDNEFHKSLSHDRRGLLSMANRGKPCTNTSQFFITLAPKKHLDRIHPVFGHIISGESVLDVIEGVGADPESSSPLKDIVIDDVVVLEDPFEQDQKEKAAASGSNDKKRLAEAIDPTLAVKRAKASANTALTIGKYMKK